jgi:hypothetical protein
MIFGSLSNAFASGISAFKSWYNLVLFSDRKEKPADSVPSSYWGSEADSPEVCRLARMHYCIRNFGAFLRRVDNMFHLKLPERFTCWLAKQPANRKCNQTVPLHFSSQATFCTIQWSERKTWNMWDGLEVERCRWFDKYSWFYISTKISSR